MTTTIIEPEYEESGAALARTSDDVRDIVSNAGFGGGVEPGEDRLALHAGTRAAVAREEAELKGALILARQFPRNETEAVTRVMKSARRPGFAEAASYAFPRGGKRVEGPSVDLARELARCWGNIRYGLRVVSVDDDRVHIKGYAYDLESNAYVETEDKFSALIQRKQQDGTTRWIRPDERDLRELVNRRGAICVRNAILQLMPPDVVDVSLAECKETVKRAAKGEIAQDREAAIRRIALAFGHLGVTVPAIEGKLGHTLDAISDDEIVELRQVYKAIVDGVGRREEYFDLNAGRPTTNVVKSNGGNGNGSATAKLADALKQREAAGSAGVEASAPASRPDNATSPPPEKPVESAPVEPEKRQREDAKPRRGKESLLD